MIVPAKKEIWVNGKCYRAGDECPDPKVPEIRVVEKAPKKIKKEVNSNE